MIAVAAVARDGGWALAWRLARRELGGGLLGLRLLAVCVFLGVAALAAVGSLQAAITGGLAERGREILGGDLEVQLPLRDATAAELAAFERAGTLSRAVRTRAMVGVGDERVLGELKAVDARWPLYGRATLAGGGDARVPLARGEVVLAPALATRIGARVGGLVEVGNARLRVGGLLADEPDRAGGGFQIGPTIVIPLAALDATGLVQPGSLVTRVNRIALPRGTDPKAAVARLRARVGGSGGWIVRDRGNAAPTLRRFVEQMGSFLALTGLASLVVAGVGVGQGVGAYLASKRASIATWKALGAGSDLIARTYLLQVGAVALAATLAGLVAGGAAPWLFATLAGDALPVSPRLGIEPVPLVRAAAYGLLAAAAFALVPLGSAARTPSARLLRGGTEATVGAGRAAWAGAGAAGTALLALAVVSAGDAALAAGFIGGVLALTGVLGLLAWALRRLAAWAPRPRSTVARLALAGITRGGATTTALIVALGLGLSLFATLAVVETSLGARLAGALPAGAPDLAFIDVPKDGIGALRAAVARAAPGARLEAVPSLRGPVSAVRGVPAATIKPPEGAWVLNGDRGLTYADALPPANRLVEGRWWPVGYAGPPLVSMDAGQAKLLGLRIGDEITVSVLGADLTARIANLRSLDFRRVSLQYMFVYNAAALRDAPHTWVATVALAPGRDGRPLQRLVARALPTASVVDLREALGTVRGLLAQILFAVRAAAAVTIAAGVAVLVGALAAGRRARIYDAVVLKMLGATRSHVLAAAALEYGALAAVVALLALATGLGAGWAVLRYALVLPFAPDPLAVAATVGAGALVTVALGLAGSWAALGASPARVLRTL